MSRTVRDHPDRWFTRRSPTETARLAGDIVEIVVADDAPGIPPVEASVVEAGRETTVEHGGGIGLWLVNWIVTRDVVRPHTTLFQ